MRYAIFSDIHSNLEAFEAVLGAYQKERIDKYLCIGDVVGYGADPNACVDKVRSIASVTVAGNHDWAAVGLFSTDDFNPDAQQAVFWTRDHLTAASKKYLESLPLRYNAEGFVLVHGSLDNPQNFNYVLNAHSCTASFQLLESNICFIGHTHVPVFFVRDPKGNVLYQDCPAIRIKPGHKYIVNVGSVGQPRDSIADAAYGIYDTEENEVQIKRVKYDVFAARQKIIDKGLPEFLGNRLLVGN